MSDKVTVEDNLEKYGSKTPFQPSPEEAQWLVEVYRNYIYCQNLKTQPQDILGGLTLEDYWDRCNYDYNVIVDVQDENDPVVPYSSTISRDKSNAFISNLTLQLLYPSVVAQNNNQEIDRIMSRASRSLLEWAHNNDGRPSMSGQQKAIMYTHKQTVEGTVHVMDNIVDGRLESTLIPNQEIYIPNFLQSDIQKQPRVFRAQMNVLYEEAEALFGHLPRFREHVVPGLIGQWTVNNDTTFQDEYQSLVIQDRLHIIWIWEDIPKRLFKKFGVPSSRESAKLFNIIINGVPMFKQDNLMPYHDGLYPISKGIFEHFSDPRFYWGNSMPGKAMQDKKWLDGWKTLIRFKAKLNAIKPYITFNGKFIDSDFFIPGEGKDAPAGMKAEDLMFLPMEGVSVSDLNILKKAEDEVNLGNLSPQTQGAQPERDQTLGQAQIIEENAQKILGSFGQQVAFLVEARTFPILKRLFQFLPKSDFKKIVVPEQSLGNGEVGNMEIIFEDIPDMTDDQKLEASFDLAKQESAKKKAKQPTKITKINPKYLKEINLYVTAVADPMPKKTSSFRQADAMRKYAFYAGDPMTFNKLPAARAVVRELGDDESEIINTQPAVNPAPGQPEQKTPGLAPAKGGQPSKATPASPNMPDFNM